MNLYLLNGRHFWNRLQPIRREEFINDVQRKKPYTRNLSIFNLKSN